MSINLYTTLDEAQGYLIKTVPRKLQILYDHMRKMNTDKTLDDEILELKDDPAGIETMFTGSTKVETETKVKLNLITKCIKRNETKIHTRLNQPADAIKLPKLEIVKFGGDPTTSKFFDSFTAAIHNFVSLKNAQKFHYLRQSLADESLHCIQDVPLTYGNYEDAVRLLKEKYGNSQVIASAHMDALVKLPEVRNENIYRLRQFYHDVELNMPSLSLLTIKTSPQEIMQIVARNVKETWNLKEIL